MRTLPADYPERAYAAVLGKLIGVYLGRPFENWTYARIVQELGPIEYYVHDRLDCPLVVTDDDIAGTFTFVRALEDHGASPNITAREIVVLGKVRGNILATDRVDIRSEGALTGDVTAARISIEDGAFFKGGIDIKKPEAKPVAASSPVSVSVPSEAPKPVQA